MSFIRVTKQNPCPICQHADWCRIFPDGYAECMRVASPTAAKSGGWMHRLSAMPKKFIPPPPPFPSPPINATKLHRDWLTQTSPAALAALATGLGLSARSLIAVDAAYAPPHAAWAFPMRDGHGNTIGIRLRNDQGKFAVRGSKQGIFTANVTPQKTLYVCEGPTDTAAAIELGLFAVGRPNCCCGGADVRTFARRHAVATIVMISDNDQPGLDGARKVGVELKMPFAIYVPPAKDVREFLRLGGTRLMLENTLKGILWQNG